MSLTLYMHPLAAYCHKTLMALYENSTPFQSYQVDLADPSSRAAFLKIWPMGRFPVLRDHARDCTVPESSVIIEYLAQHYPGEITLLPNDTDRAREVRLWDRFIDLYVQDQMSKIVTDRLRPEDQHDHYGVARARETLRTACDQLEAKLHARTWLVDDVFSMADCAAAPALFYTNMVMPLEDAHPNTAAYLLRLMQRPSYARVLREASPYLRLVPKEAIAS
jgi:glutathione S-transferase